MLENLICRLSRVWHVAVLYIFMFLPQLEMTIPILLNIYNLNNHERLNLKVFLFYIILFGNLWRAYKEPTTVVCCIIINIIILYFICYSKLSFQDRKRNY